MYFLISHIYREKNPCANKLENYGLIKHCFSPWYLVPNFALEDFNRYKLGAPLIIFDDIFFLLKVYV